MIVQQNEYSISFVSNIERNYIRRVYSARGFDINE